MGNNNLDEVSDVLYRVQRGLAGYVSYLAACEMNAAFSEYILYEPVLRILTARNLKVRSEVPCPGYLRVKQGDVKRLDFVAEGVNVNFALEIKWAKSGRPRVLGDLEKLCKFRSAHPKFLGFLCVFGRKSTLESLILPQSFHEKGSAVYAEFGRTRYGCRIYQLGEHAES